MDDVFQKQQDENLMTKISGGLHVKFRFSPDLLGEDEIKVSLRGKNKRTRKEQKHNERTKGQEKNKSTRKEHKHNLTFKEANNKDQIECKNL